MIKLRQYLFLSQASFLVCLLICSLILPGVAEKEGGISNFGNHLSTVWLYAIGFLSNTAFIYLAANWINKHTSHLRFIVRLLKLLCWLTLLVFASTFPRHVSFTFSVIHDDLGIALFSVEFLVSLYLIKKQFNFRSFSYLTIQVLGSILGLLSIIKVVDWLFFGQIVGALGFGLMLVLVLPVVVDEQLTIN